jgi:tetratricopeptide (TPR) repeat protein
VVWISFLFLALLALPMLSPHRLNLRFTCVLFGPLCLLGGLGFCYVFTSVRNWLAVLDGRLVVGLAAAALAVAAAVDYHTFQSMFVQKDLRDLSLKMILDSTQPTSGPRVTQTIARSQGSVPGISAAEKLAQNESTPEHFLELSLLYHQAGRYQDCIDAAKKALQLKPDYAEAYNNIAAAYEAMSQWDLAIENAQQAVRLKPDFQLARNNLAYSQAQKQRAR